MPKLSGREGAADPVHTGVLASAPNPMQGVLEEAAAGGWLLDVQLTCGIRLPDINCLSVDGGVATLVRTREDALYKLDTTPGVIAYIVVKN